MAVILLITLGAIWKYPQVGSVLQLWAAFGTLTGAMATYFFTREQVQRQESQIKMYQTALQASEMDKAEVAGQFIKVAAKIKPDLESSQSQQLLEKYELIAKELARVKIPAVNITKNPSSPSPKPTVPDAFFDLFKRNPASPSPSWSP